MIDATSYTCRISIIFGTLKDNSLQNGVKALSQLVLRSSCCCCFGQKAQDFVHFGLYDLVQMSPACGQNTYQILLYGETLNFQC